MGWPILPRCDGFGTGILGKLLLELCVFLDLGLRHHLIEAEKI
jgi:hypothetical protein